MKAQKNFDTSDPRWANEPDEQQWTYPDHTGEPSYVLTVHRNPLGAWCGYVGIPSDHALHGTPYGEAPDFEVHGGLSYSDLAHPMGAYNADAGYWWFGFDCAHAGDLVPGIVAMGLGGDTDTYRDITFVMKNVQALADQLAEWHYLYEDADRIADERKRLINILEDDKDKEDEAIMQRIHEQLRAALATVYDDSAPED